MDIHEHIPALGGWSSLPAAGFGNFKKNDTPGILSMYILKIIDFYGFEAPLVKTSTSWHSGQMTMPARRASKFCAKRCAVTPEVFSQSLIYSVISGTIEPWPECQPEQ